MILSLFRMKEYPLGDGKILLVKNKDGELSAIGNKCTHYNAPLKSGVRFIFHIYH